MEAFQGYYYGKYVELKTKLIAGVQKIYYRVFVVQDDGETLTVKYDSGGDHFTDKIRRSIIQSIRVFAN